MAICKSNDPLDTSSSYRAQREIVDNINTFVASSAQPQFGVSCGGNFGGTLVALSSVLGASMLIIGGIQTMFTTWTFDRVQGFLIYRSETIFGIRINKRALKNISSVDMVHNRSSKGGSTYHIELWTWDGERIHLFSWLGDKKSTKCAAEAIKVFL